MSHNFTSGLDFGHALVAHFNLPAGQVERGVKVNFGAGEIFGVTLRIALTADDLVAIAGRMKCAGSGAYEDMMARAYQVK